MPRRRPIIGGNWKMNTTRHSAADLAQALVQRLEHSDCDVVLFPPFPMLETVWRSVEGSALELGAQDTFWEDSGAYTGEVSVPMLQSVGCNWVIVGHSERRHIFGESDEVVNRKLHAALHHEMNVVLAIGETQEQRRAGWVHEVCRAQLQHSLAGVEPDMMEHVVIAYEPVWAIGTGETATPQEAQGAHAYVREVLAELFGEDRAQATRIQYGGSVTATNAAELLGQPDVDGALVGGASLKAPDFAAIVEAAGAVKPNP